MPANDWAPARPVNLSPYYIDAFKVTWGRYRACVAAGICSREGLDRRPETRRAFDDPSLADLPAAGISYAEAAEFCLWSGKRLPTEAEWERAARGPSGSDYPWGDGPPAPELLARSISYGYARELPPAVTDDGGDVSVEGVHGLVTGEAEWVADWYDPVSYREAGTLDPRGPAAPVFKTYRHEYGEANWIPVHGSRVVRGWRGSAAGGADWDAVQRGAPSWFRGARDPKAGASFRCARSAIRQPPAPAVYSNLQWRSFAPKGGAK